MHSQSAEATAAIRATHFLHGNRPLVFEDPFAIEFINSAWCQICHGGNDLCMTGGGVIILGPARYTEALLDAAVSSRVDQYVILGAGLDTFALRRPDLLSGIRVYEIDHPETQSWKRERLIQLGHKLPDALEFISADLEHETVARALSHSSY